MPLDTAISLVSVDDAAQILNVEESGLIELERLINSASSRIERYCRTRFKKRTLTLTLNGPDFDLLDLGSPVVSVASVTLGGVALTASDYEVLNERGQLLRSGGWTDPIGSRPQGIKNVVVSGDFGWDPVPHEVITALYMIMRVRLNRVGSEGLQSESIGDYSYTRFGQTAVTQSVGAEDIPEEARHILDPYVRQSL